MIVAPKSLKNPKVIKRGRLFWTLRGKSRSYFLRGSYERSGTVHETAYCLASETEAYLFGMIYLDNLPGSPAIELPDLLPLIDLAGPVFSKEQGFPPTGSLVISEGGPSIAVRPPNGAHVDDSWIVDLADGNLRYMETLDWVAFADWSLASEDLSLPPLLAFNEAGGSARD